MLPNSDARAQRRAFGVCWTARTLERCAGGFWLPLAVILLGLASVAAAPEQHHYLIVGTPGADAGGSAAGVSLLVFDADNEHRLVTRIPIWPPDTATPEHVRGMAVSAPIATSETQASRRLYVSTTRRLAAIDLSSGRVIWERDFGGACCERMAVAPDGRTLHVPALGRAFWYVVDAATGALRASVPVMGWPRSTVVAPEGDRVFLAPWESKEMFVADTTSNAVVRTVGPFSDYLCPFTTNASGTMAFANVDRLVGFEVGDLLSGMVIERVQIDDYDPEQVNAYECPSHGIAFAPGDRELWVADGVGNRLRVFDSRPLPPVLAATIQLERQPRWITFGVDGRYAYASTGDVIDAASKTIVATLKDEHGRTVESERMLTISMSPPLAGWRP